MMKNKNPYKGLFNELKEKYNDCIDRKSER